MLLVQDETGFKFAPSSYTKEKKKDVTVIKEGECEVEIFYMYAITEKSKV